MKTLSHPGSFPHGHHDLFFKGRATLAQQVWPRMSSGKPTVMSMSKDPQQQGLLTLWPEGFNYILPVREGSWICFSGVAFSAFE